MRSCLNALRTLVIGAAEQEEQPELLEELAKAHGEWQAAQHIFTEATDPQLIEWAVINMKSCEQRYMYLWHQARHAGLRGSIRLRA